MKDVFLSHTSSDKPKVVDFARELARRDITYWLDEAEIKWGDRISKRINDGLREARFVIVFLSESFVGRNWPESELGSAIARENEEGQTVVLPIIIGDPGPLLSSYPLLREKAYLKWDLGAARLVDHLQNRLAGIGPHSEELSTLDRDWRSSLLDFLDKHRGVFEASGRSEASLASLRLRISAPDLSFDVASSLIEDFVLTSIQEAQNKISPLAQALSLANKESELRAVVENIKSRSAVEIKALCLRECIPVNLDIIDFYADAANRTRKWATDFFGNLSAFERWTFNRTGPPTAELAKFLSSKMYILVGDWKAESLRAVLRDVAAKVGPQVSRIATAFYEAVRKEVAQAELPQFESRILGEVSVSSPALAGWMEKKVTTTWLTLFSNPSFLYIAQMTTARAKATPQERLHAFLVREILSNGEQQEASFSKDLAEHISRSFIYLSMGGPDPTKQKELRERFAQEQRILRELQEVGFHGIGSGLNPSSKPRTSL